MAKVTLDMETFKALASSTRLQVLRALDERRKTLSELSKELELNKATVHEHMQILLATGLIKKRDDEGRKWIYYELTWQGERILHPQETTTFMVLLGLGTAAAGGGVMMLGKALEWWWVEKQVQGDETAFGPAGAPEQAGVASDSSDDGASPGAEHDAMEMRAGDGDTAADDGGSPLDFLNDGDGMLSVLLFVTAALMAFLGIMIRRRRPAS